MPSEINDPNQNNASLEALVRENLELTRQIYALTEKTRRYIFYGQVLGVVKIVLIVGPLIVGAFYLAPLLKQTLGLYSGLLGGGTSLPTLAPTDSQPALEDNPILKKFLDNNLAP